MGRRFLTLLPLAASGLVLAVALSAPAVASEDKDFGCTVTRNIETQTVDMNPRYAGTLMEGGVGKRSAAAVARYMTDKIRPLTKLDGSAAVGAQGGADSKATGSEVVLGGN
ncbi:hypothetical protein FJQ54_07970 [Sandaracinobacter neustonicus]|uniref:Uncharacterized protein n=1 Tax=Sandaracinobacter neustonicus TaxID=1715348 RepID=A0A501XMB4_9SPHN|nr:hypothetical protein [Sandaracinobacter neustonicus]TPE61821.1 hypothetical protein FJQ54_07970 [Sandaracinobacter neustonicus]